MKNSKFSETDFRKPSLEQIQKLLEIFMPKKTEECYKFILARALNHMKAELESRLDTSVSVENFYEVYFAETAGKYGIPVTDFHYPLTKDLKGKINLNYSYFGKVFKCQKFVDDMEVLFDRQIFASHMEEIYKKLYSVVLKWEKMYSRLLIMKDMSESQLLEEIASHQRYKIPWTCTELMQAIAKFRKLVKMCQEKSEKEKGKVGK